VDELLRSIDAKLDKVVDKVTSLEITSAKQELNLEEHMKRSDTLEAMHNQLKEEVEPIKASVNKINTVVSVIWKISIYILIPLIAAVITTLHLMK